MDAEAREEREREREKEREREREREFVFNSADRGEMGNELAQTEFMIA